MQSIRLVFIDLDGTLLSSSHEILGTSENAIRQLISKNIHVVVTTGRSFSGMQEAVKSLPFSLPSPVSVHNGALILDKQKVARKLLLKKDSIVDLVSKARQLKLHIGFQTDFETYLEEAMGRFEWIYKLHGIDPVIVEDLLELEIDLVKVSFYGDEDDVSSLLAHFDEGGKSEEVSLFRSGLYFADATAKQATKLHAAKWISKTLNLTSENVLAIGDQANDVEMLKWAEVGVAMGNAEDHVKKIANFVTRSNDDDGIYFALKSHGLLP